MCSGFWPERLHLWTNRSKISGKRMPPHQFALTEGLTEGMSFDMEIVPDLRIAEAI